MVQTSLKNGDSRISYFGIVWSHVSAYRKNHGTDTVLLILAEQWRKELDQYNITGIVSMDLSKAFDNLNLMELTITPPTYCSS